MTSEHPYSSVSANNDARILLTPCPGTKEIGVRDSVKQLSMAGARALITLMSTDELVGCNAADLGEICAEEGMLWFQFPISDEQNPDAEFQKKWLENRSEIQDLLSEGSDIAIHCKGGSGRTGLITCQLLMETGIPLLDSYDMVKSVKSKAITKPNHRRYIENL